MPARRAERLRGRAGQKQRARRLRRSGGLCERCLERGRTSPATVVDHIVPLALGGSDDDENTRNLCGPCHREATAQQFWLASPVGKGVDASGRPTFTDHPWNLNGPGGSKV